MAFFLEFWTPWFLGHHRLSIRCSQRSISLRQTLRKVMRAFMRLVTTFRNVCKVFHALWAADWGNWTFWFFSNTPSSKCHNRQKSGGVILVYIFAPSKIEEVTRLWKTSSSESLVVDSNPLTFCTFENFHIMLVEEVQLRRIQHRS